MQEFLSYPLWNNTVEKYLWFLGIVLLAVVFKKIISKKLGSLIYSAFKKFAHEAEAVEKFFSLLTKPIGYLIVLIAVSFAVNILDYPVAAKGKKSIEDMLHLALQVTSVIIITWISLRMIDFITFVLAKKADKTPTKTDDQIIPFVRETLKITTLIFSLLFVLGAVLDINVGTLIAGLGIGGLAIALAAQETVANLLASFIIFFDKPFTVGDYIMTNNIEGVVEKIGFRSTRIRTLEQSYLTVPNNLLIKDKLDNLTKRELRRAKYYIGIPYSTPGETIKAVVQDIRKSVDDHPKTNKDGMVFFEQFAESSFNIMILYFVKTQEHREYLTVMEEINYKIIAAVKKNGCDFALPSRSVHLLKEN